MTEDQKTLFQFESEEAHGKSLDALQHSRDRRGQILQLFDYELPMSIMKAKIKYRQTDQSSLTYRECDWVICPWDKKKLILFEEKQGCGSFTRGQNVIFPVIDEALKIGCAAIGWQYDGFHRINYDVHTEDVQAVRVLETLIKTYGKTLYDADDGLVKPINFSVNDKSKTEEEIIKYFNKFILEGRK